MNLDYVQNQRGLKFIKRGMKVENTYSKKIGVITGGNSSGNINVKFEGETKASNCHPTWMMKYFDQDGNVIAEYKD